MLQPSLLCSAISNVSVEADVGAELFREFGVTGKCTKGRVEVNASEEGINLNYETFEVRINLLSSHSGSLSLSMAVH